MSNSKSELGREKFKFISECYGVRVWLNLLSILKEVSLNKKENFSNRLVYREKKLLKRS